MIANSIFALQTAATLSPLEIIFIIAFATAHGYAAAWLAVRMLFRPRQPIRFLGVTVFPQGMIPRHRARLAETIGKAVGTELVSQETITDALFETDFFRRKVDQIVTSYTDDLLTTNYPSLIEALPRGVRAPVLDAVSALQLTIAEHIERVLRSDEMHRSLEHFIDRRLDSLLSQRLKDALDSQVFEQAVQVLEDGLRSVTTAPDFENRVRLFISARVDDIAGTRATLADVFTIDAVAIIKERIDREVTPIVHHLAEIATSQRTRTQIGALIKREVDDYYNQLSFIKKIFVSRERINTEVDELVDSTLPRRIEEYLRGDAFAVQAKEFLDSTIDNVLHRPVGDLVGKLDPNALDVLKDRIAAQVLTLARSHEIRDAISAYARTTLARLQPHSLGAIMQHIKPESDEALKSYVAKFVLSVLARPETANTLNLIVNNQIERLLAQPIGRPIDYLAPDALVRTSSALTERITQAARERLPAAIKEFDIAGIVRQKVSAYPVEKLENLVLSVAGQHLHTIELFGLVIGFLLGIAQAGYFLARPYIRSLFG